MDIEYFFRKPAYPIICNINNNLIAARSGTSLAAELDNYKLIEEDYDIIDITSEGWSFCPEQNIISPLTFKKKWNKKEIINLYNNSNNVQEKYLEKSISNKRFDRIFNDLVELILRQNKIDHNK